MKRQATPILGVLAATLVVFGADAALGGGASLITAAKFRVGKTTDVSSSCSGDSAEVEQATDPVRGYVYETWMGCNGIALARSLDRGRSFGAPVTVTGSGGDTDDPSVAVAPDGTVYTAFMAGSGGQRYPAVATSVDHGATFARVTPLSPPPGKNFGDRDFISVGPDGAVYVTWSYGPNPGSVTYICPGESCSFSSGEMNIVMQRSTDGGRTFGPMSHVSPGFPGGGADSAPLVVEPSGRIDVLYQSYQVAHPSHRFGPAYMYFTSSRDGGRTWSPPVQVGGRAGSMSTAEWWIDGDIAADAGGNLYATWDTQRGSTADVGWLSYSTDHGRHWSSPVQVSPDRRPVPHMMEVAGGDAGIAYVGWLADADRRGYAAYVRAFSLDSGRLRGTTRVSRAFGARSVWPGDTFGISTLSPKHLVLSWGSATTATAGQSHIFAATASVKFR